MAGLFSILGSTATALDAQSQAIAVTSNNIANLNNSTYSVETVSFDELPSVATADGPQATGVTTTVEQQRSAVLDQMVQQQASITSGFEAMQNVLQQAQASLGDDITNTSTSASSDSTSSTTVSGLTASLSDFFNAFENLASNPTDTGAQQTVYQDAGVLTDRFQQIDQSLTQVQSDAGSQAASDVSTANGLLQQVAQLNGQIVSAQASEPGSADSLIDQREGVLEQLAGLMPITVQANAQGEDQVSTSDSQGNSVVLVRNAAVANSLSYSDGTVSAGNPPTALGLSSGSIEGTLSASTGAVQTLRASLDQLAAQIVTSVNAAYNPDGTTGGNFFDASGLTAGTIALDPNLTAANLTAGTGAAGDNSIALAAANVGSQSFSTANGDLIDGSIADYYSGAVSTLGEALDSANTQVTDQTNVQTIIVNQRQSVSGVDLDQEMSNLMMYQNAYQASSEVLATINTLFTDFFDNFTGN